jgi:bifunctional DNA-binding transcriptional regulator/antitoxin component of YhaV-PrlF toxin-antitoxin module
MRHGTSGVIALPKGYRDYHGLNPGQNVIILYDSLLLIIPRDLEYLIENKKSLIDQLLGQAEKRIPEKAASEEGLAR